MSGKSLDLNSLLSKEEYTDETYVDMGNELGSHANTQVADVYIERTKNDIKVRLEDKGYSVNSVDVQVEVEDEARYGELNQINLNISNKQEENVKEQSKQVNSISEVENVNVVISNQNSNENVIENEESSNISEENMNEIKSLLENIYGINKENIYINV